MNSEKKEHKLEHSSDDIKIVTSQADVEEITEAAKTADLGSLKEDSSTVLPKLEFSEEQTNQSAIKQSSVPQLFDKQIDLPKIAVKKSLAQNCVFAWIVFVISSIAMATLHSIFSPGPIPYLMPISSGVFVGFLIIPALIFLPMTLAGVRKSSKSNLVVLLNTLLGWSGIGWAAALWIALKSSPKTEHRISSAYRNALISLIGISVITCIGYIPGCGAITAFGILASLFDPIQSMLALITQRRLKETNQAAAYLGPIQAWLGANISSLTTTGIMTAVDAQVIDTLFLHAQNPDKNTIIAILAFSTWLVVATLLIQSFGIGLYYYRLSKDLEDATSKRLTGIPYRCLLTGLGPAISVLWTALNCGADNWFQHFGLAISLGQLWSMAFMYIAVRDWENKTTANVANADREH